MKKFEAQKEQCFLLSFMVLILILLSGCSPSAKSAKEIIADLQQNPAFLSQTVEIDSYEIIKRQTDKNNNSDLVYIMVTINEEKLNCTLSYIMQYILYNDGWILESVERYEDGPWSISGLTEEQVLMDIQEKDEFFKDQKDMTITECTMSDLYLQDEYKPYVYVSVVAENIDSWCELPSESVLYQASYKMWYDIKSGDWINGSFFCEESNCGPKYPPTAVFIDALGERLAEDLQYESCTYSHMEEDLNRNKFTIYYHAKKVCEFGNQINLISVPAWLSINPLVGGATFAFWNWDRDKTRAEFETIEWDLEGVWTSSGTSDDSNWDIWLSMKNIQNNGSSKEFSADVACDAAYIWDDGTTVEYKTDGYTTVSIKPQWQDEYGFTIWDAEGTMWGRDFIIRLSSNDAGLGGVTWKYRYIPLVRKHE